MKDQHIETSVDLKDEKIHWDQDVSYGQYLDLDNLLGAQHLRSNKHDEMMFIIIHQASELWMKLSIHELTAAMKCVSENNLDGAMKMIARIARIQEQLTQSWNVLSTMTPMDYLSFRETLGQSSGFQSHQYRMIEFSLGIKNKEMIKAHQGNPDIFQMVKKTLDAPSLYDLTLQLLAKRGFDVPEDCLERDWSDPYEPRQEIEDIWKQVYLNNQKYWDLYDWAEKLVDLEHRFQSWRFAHMKTVERIIGFRKGTGGTGGVSYLVKALDLRFFPELWTVRTSL